MTNALPSLPADADPLAGLLWAVARRADVLARWRGSGPVADRQVWLRAECEILGVLEARAPGCWSEDRAGERERWTAFGDAA